MKPTPRDKKPQTTAEGEQDDRHRDDAEREPNASERAGRISATQMAAPSTRRWRRAGRFEQAS
jgi:hypothetical protein